MDTTKFQTSFIPNKNTSGLDQTGSSGIVHTIGITLFVIAVVASAGVYGYEKYLSGAIRSLDTKLVEARDSLDPESIAKLTQTNSQFISANEIISKHLVPSSFFELLQQKTLRTLRFTSLSYETDKFGVVKVRMKGTARSYGVIAQQAKVFGEEPLIMNPQFSDLDLNKEGDVVFSFQAQIDKKAVSYERLIGGDTSSTPIVPAQTSTTSPAQIVPAASSTSSINQTSSSTRVTSAVSTSTKRQ